MTFGTVRSSRTDVARLLRLRDPRAMSSIPVGAGRAWALERVKTRFELGALLPILAPAALLAVVLVAIGRQLLVTDTWVGLVSGREIARHGLPHVEHLTVIAQGRHWVDQQWLAQLIMYGLARAGSWGNSACSGLTPTIAAPCAPHCSTIPAKSVKSPMPKLRCERTP